MPFKDVASWKEAQKAAKLAKHARLYGKSAKLADVEAEMKAKIGEYYQNLGKKAVSEAKIDPNQAFREKKGLSMSPLDDFKKWDSIADKMVKSKPETIDVTVMGGPPEEVELPEGYTSWAEVPDEPEDEDYDIDDIFDNPDGN